MKEEIEQQGKKKKEEGFLFSVRVSPEVKERCEKILDEYRDGAKREVGLVKIFDLAENDMVRGKHPELGGQLKAVDETIRTLVKQIDGIVAGQDLQIDELKGKVNKAVTERQEMKDKASKALNEAKTLKDEATATIKKAEEDAKAIREKADLDVKTAQKDAAFQTEKANMERDKAVQERDDARTIADEKTASNDLLVKQMADMSADVTAYKELRASYSALVEKSKDDARTHAEEMKDLRRDMDAIQKDLDRLQTSHEALASENTTLKERVTAMEHDAVKAESEARIELEKAVIAKEREMNQALREKEREMDQAAREKEREMMRENARLAAKIEQLQEQISNLQR